jgi:hypothetical protein
VSGFVCHFFHADDQRESISPDPTAMSPAGGNRAEPQAAST